MKLKLEISGMSCDHCINFVKQALTDMEGVRVLGVDLVSANVECDESVSEDQIKEVIEEAGYELDRVVVL